MPMSISTVLILAALAFLAVRALFREKVAERSSSNPYIRYVNQVVATLDELEDSCPSVVWYDLRQDSINVLNADRKRTVEYFERKKCKPSEWAITSVFNRCGDCLESGQYHLYRGVLNTEGQEYLKVYQFLESQLLNRGIATQEWLDKNRSILFSNINSVG